MFNWAKAEYKNAGVFQGDNPVLIISELKEKRTYKRKNSRIMKQELKAWFDAVEKQPTIYREYFLFLLFTGVRADNEAGVLTWDRVNYRTRTFKLIDTKNKVDVDLSLPSYSLPMLKKRRKKNGLVFPIENHARTPCEDIIAQSEVFFHGVT